MYRIIFLLLSLMLATSALSSEMRNKVKIKITVGTSVAVAVMEDNPTSNEFVSRLPLTLELKDYSNTEKIHYLSKKLTTANAPDGITPKPGDITYYAPWGNLALFYKRFSYSSGLIMLGKFESGLDILKSDSSIIAKFEIME